MRNVELFQTERSRNQTHPHFEGPFYLLTSGLLQQLSINHLQTFLCVFRTDSPILFILVKSSSWFCSWLHFWPFSTNCTGTYFEILRQRSFVWCRSPAESSEALCGHKIRPTQSVTYRSVTYLEKKKAPWKFPLINHQRDSMISLYEDK